MYTCLQVGIWGGLSRGGITGRGITGGGITGRGITKKGGKREKLVTAGWGFPAATWTGGWGF